MKWPYLIGIAGGTASGKSTFSDYLEKQLQEYRIMVFHMDSYFKPKEIRPKAKAHVSGKVYLDDNCPETIHHERLRRDLEAARDEHYDFILVEGLFALWYEWLYEMLDIKLFIDCQADERIVRRLRRNMAERGLSFDEISEVYLDMVRYRHEQYIEPTKWRADFILNGSSPSFLANDILVDFLKRQAVPPVGHGREGINK